MYTNRFNQTLLQFVLWNNTLVRYESYDPHPLFEDIYDPITSNPDR